MPISRRKRLNFTWKSRSECRQGGKKEARRAWAVGENNTQLMRGEQGPTAQSYEKRQTKATGRKKHIFAQKNDYWWLKRGNEDPRTRPTKKMRRRRDKRPLLSGFLAEKRRTQAPLLRKVKTVKKKVESCWPSNREKGGCSTKFATEGGFLANWAKIIY